MSDYKKRKYDYESEYEKEEKDRINKIFNDKIVNENDQPSKYQEEDFKTEYHEKILRIIIADEPRFIRNK